MIFLNVWTPNELGIKFYEKWGFEVVETIDEYYKDLEPSTAKVLVRKL